MERFEDLVDLLLGWLFDPDLAQQDRWAVYWLSGPGFEFKIHLIFSKLKLDMNSVARGCSRWAAGLAVRPRPRAAGQVGPAPAARSRSEPELLRIMNSEFGSTGGCVCTALACLGLTRERPVPSALPVHLDP